MEKRNFFISKFSFSFQLIREIKKFYSFVLTIKKFYLIVFHAIYHGWKEISSCYNIISIINVKSSLVIISKNFLVFLVGFVWYWSDWIPLVSLIVSQLLTSFCYSCIFIEPLSKIAHEKKKILTRSHHVDFALHN